MIPQGGEWKDLRRSWKQDDGAHLCPSWNFLFLQRAALPAGIFFDCDRQPCRSQHREAYTLCDTTLDFPGAQIWQWLPSRQLLTIALSSRFGKLDVYFYPFSTALKPHPFSSASGLPSFAPLSLLLRLPFSLSDAFLGRLM